MRVPVYVRRRDKSFPGGDARLDDCPGYPNRMRFGATVLYVNDVLATIDFYKRAFGLVVRFHDEALGFAVAPWPANVLSTMKLSRAASLVGTGGARRLAVQPESRPGKVAGSRAFAQWRQGRQRSTVGRQSQPRWCSFRNRSGRLPRSVPAPSSCVRRYLAQYREMGDPRPSRIEANLEPLSARIFRYVAPVRIAVHNGMPCLKGRRTGLQTGVFDDLRELIGEDTEIHHQQ